jgi:hypothetical protein
LTIKFFCACGQKLRARDEMAKHRMRCPRCGGPVGVPSLEPIHPGGLAPLTPWQREMLARKRKAAAGEPVAETPEAPPKPPSSRVRLLADKAKRRADLAGRHLEKHWYECLLYPLRALRFCLGLALILMALSASLALFVPQLFLGPPPDDTWTMTLYCLAVVVPLVLLVALPCSFLDCVLISAAAGEVYYIRWSGNPLLTLLYSGAKWLGCFLAGPVLFAGLAVLYWLQCGDPDRLDWLILAELGLVGVAYQAYALLAVSSRGWLAGLNPVAVIDLAHRLSWRTLAVVFAAALVLLAHGLALVAGVAEVHDNPLPGLFMVTAAWLSGVFWGTFFCRLLGIRCYLIQASQDEADEGDNKVLKEQ